MGEESKYTTISFPKEIVEAIRKLIKDLKYWPSITSFAREAVLEKIKQERKVLKELRENGGRKDDDKGTHEPCT